MKAVMLMFDSLNRRMLEPYGCDWVKTPNFSRLARRCATFERNFAGSLPCIPARRELQTGRYNFLHNTWGPMEPFDDSMPEMLKKAGIYTHLVSDHLHYWEEGGATYHTKYSTWEIVRGQEGDPWIPCPDERSEFPGEERWRMQDRVNRRVMSAEPDMPMPQVFARGIDFLERFHNSDNWFLQIETFDPHEPCTCDGRRRIYRTYPLPERGAPFHVRPLPGGASGRIRPVESLGRHHAHH